MPKNSLRQQLLGRLLRLPAQKSLRVTNRNVKVIVQHDADLAATGRNDCDVSIVAGVAELIDIEVRPDLLVLLAPENDELMDAVRDHAMRHELAYQCPTVANEIW